MKQILLSLLALVALTLPTFADQSGYCGNLVAWTFNESTKTLTISGSGAIDDCLFESPFESLGISTVVIEEGITKIGNCVFMDCSTITTAIIPSTTTSIGTDAFWGCAGLTSFTIGNSVTSIGDGAFYECTELTSLSIGNNVTSIGESAFWGCTKLASVTIPNSVKTIGESAFAACSSLSSVTLPTSVTSISNYLFSKCTSLTTITIPSSVTSIGSCAFWGAGLTSVIIPDSVTTIGNSAFNACSALESVKVGSSVTKLGRCAFYGCSSLKEIYARGETPSVCAEDVFTNVDLKKCKVYVPKSPEITIELYKCEDGWRDFENIQAYDTSHDDADYQARKKKCDINDDGFVNAADVVGIYNFIINGK